MEVVKRLSADKRSSTSGGLRALEQCTWRRESSKCSRCRTCALVSTLVLAAAYQACRTATCPPHTPHLLGQVARALWRVEDLVVEHGEVEGQAQADGVGGRQVHQRNVLRCAWQAGAERCQGVGRMQQRGRTGCRAAGQLGQQLCAQDVRTTGGLHQSTDCWSQAAPAARCWLCCCLQHSRAVVSSRAASGACIDALAAADTGWPRRPRPGESPCILPWPPPHCSALRCRMPPRCAACNNLHSPQPSNSTCPQQLRTCAALYASSVCSAASLRSAPVLNSAR